MSMRDEQLECLRCHKQLVPYDRWKAATPDERAAMKRNRMARGVRRDMCAACYQYLRSHGLLERYTPERRRAPGEPSEHRCVRCGHSSVHLGTLCRDCADVTYDLQERQAWVG